MLEPTDNKWFHYDIFGVGMGREIGVSTPIGWTFYGCEVRNL